MDLNSLFSLAGKVIVLTGGYGYLGEAIARGLASAGAEVVVFGRSEEKFSLKLASFKLISFETTDVTSTTSVQEAYARVNARFGKIDVLINNAHYGMSGKVDALSDEAWQATMDGTVGNYHRCLREVLPYFRKQGSGNVINVSSMYGLVAPDFDLYKAFPAFTNPPNYGAGKAATLQLTRYFASLLGKENIRVNSVSPGPFPSLNVQKHELFVEELSSRTVLGRIGQPEELIGVFIYLASSSASYMTGQNLVIDGGWTIT